MRSSGIVSSVFLAVFVEYSLQDGHFERNSIAHLGGGSPWNDGGYGNGYGGSYGQGFRGSYGNYKGQRGYEGFGSYKGYGGFGGFGGYGGNRGYGGVGGTGGSLGADGYGFNIVDTPEKYGYESVYPGGHTEFYLLGPVGPGQKGIEQGLGQDRRWGSSYKGWNGQGWSQNA